MTGKAPSGKAKTKAKKPASSKADADADKEPKAKKAPKADNEMGGSYDSLAERFGSLNPARTAETGPDGEAIELPDAVDGDGSVVANTPGNGSGLGRAMALAGMAALALLSVAGFVYLGKRWRRNLWEL